MRMHRFKTPTEANQACFVPRSLATLSIKHVEVAESSPGYPVSGRAALLPTAWSFLSEGKLEVTVSAACVSGCPDYSGERAHPPVLLQSITEGFLLFDPVFQLWRNTDSQMLGFTGTLALSSSSGYSTSWLELHAGITSHRTQELVSA